MPKKRADKDKWESARKRALASIEAMSDEEDEAVTAAALADPDNPPRDEAWFRRARRYEDIAPELEKRRRGQRGPQKAPTKSLVSLRLDPDVIEHFRQTGRGWQSRINAALRKAAGLE